MADETVNEGQDYEGQARQTGWVPLDEFQGAKEKWFDAETWVKRGQTYIPFLTKSNQQLKGQLSAVEQELMEQRRMNAATQKAFEELKTDFTEIRSQATATEKEELIEQIVAAREAGDVRKELRLREDLDELNIRSRAASSPRSGSESSPSPNLGAAPNGGTASQPTIPPHVQEPLNRFIADNPWFEKDRVMAAAALAYMNELNMNGESRALSPEEKFNRVSVEIRKRFNMPDNTRRSAPSRVEAGGPTDTSRMGGNSYADLPAEAKRLCDTLSARFVGKPNGRGEIKYKDVNAYREQYARDYFDEDWGTKVLKQ